MSFLFLSSAYHQFPFVGVCYSVFFLLSGSNVAIRLANGGSTIGVCTMQPFEACPWHVIVPPGDALWPTPGMNWVVDPSIASSRGKLHDTMPAVLQPFIWYDGVYNLGLGRVSWSLHLLYMAWRGLLFQVLLHPITWLTPTLWWALNLVIPVWWLGIKLMNLYTPGWLNILLLHTFILGSQAICQHLPISCLNSRGWLLFFWSDSCRLWAWS